MSIFKKKRVRKAVGGEMETRLPRCPASHLADGMCSMTRLCITRDISSLNLGEGKDDFVPCGKNASWGSLGEGREGDGGAFSRLTCTTGQLGGWERK